MSFIRILLTVGMLGLPMPAFAERYETTRIFNYKAWSVVRTHDQFEDKLWCNAETRNRSGQALSLIAYEKGHLGIFIFDHRWELSPRDIEFRFDIDYSRWEASGYAEENYISAFLEQPEDIIRLISELAEGSAISTYNADGRRVASHSLSGSSASLRRFMKCWSSIRKTDPFGTAPGKKTPKSDPF